MICLIIFQEVIFQEVRLIAFIDRPNAIPVFRAEWNIIEQHLIIFENAHFLIISDCRQERKQASVWNSIGDVLEITLCNHTTYLILALVVRQIGLRLGRARAVGRTLSENVTFVHHHGKLIKIAFSIRRTANCTRHTTLTLTSSRIARPWTRRCRAVRSIRAHRGTADPSANFQLAIFGKHHHHTT